MGLVDFFRKITKKKAEESEIGQEKIAFSEVENWIKGKRNEIKVRESKILVLVQDKINVLINELKEKINIAKGVDIESKKAESKINSLVEEGRKKYIEFVESFIEDLKSLEKKGFEKFIAEIDKVFLNFNKSSHMSYERATILIGKEMADIKESIKVFSRDLVKLFNENKDIADLSKIIPLAKLKLNQISETEETLGRVNDEIIFLDRKITEKKEENKKILEEIEKIKKSEDYLKDLGKQEKIKLLEEELEKDILGLRQLIDFKALANFFHIFEKQMNIVKVHREDFQASFKKDNGKSILDLLNESKLNNEVISEKIKQINNKKEEIIKNKQEIKKDETEELYSKITNMVIEIGNLMNQKTREEKRYTKLKASKEDIIKELKEEFKKMNVELVN